MIDQTPTNPQPLPKSLSQLRHDIRNYLNAIKLCSALLQRRHRDPLDAESLHEIDRSADGINDLVTRCMSLEQMSSFTASESKTAHH